MSNLCRTISVEDAGKILGYSRNSAYEAAKTGELPTIRLGRKLRVPRAALEKMLGEPISASP
jgi:excisionase family DNA binding protein